MTGVQYVDEPKLFDQPSITRAVRVTVLVILFSALAISAVTLILKWRLTPQLAFLAAVSSLVALILSRSRRFKLAIFLPLVTITYAVLHLAARSDGIQNVGLTIIPVLIVVESFMFDGLLLVFFTAGSILAVIGMLAMRYFVLHAERWSTNDMGDLFVFTLTCVIAAVVGRLFTLRIQEGFRGGWESESRYRRMFENVTDVYCEMSTEGILLEVSPSSVALFGVARGQMVGRPLASFCVNGLGFDTLLSALRSNGRVSNHELVIDHPGIGARSVLINACLQSAPKTTEERIIGSLRDITECKHLEEELRRRAEELEQIMNVAPVALLVAHDPDCRHVTANGMAASVIAVGEATDMSIAASTPGSEPRRFFREGIEIPSEELPLQLAARGREVRNCELEVLLPNGSRRFLLAQATPLRDAAGHVRGAVAADLDVTPVRQRSDDLLHESEERFRNIADAAPVIMWLGDIEKRVIFVNKQIALFTGVPAEKLLIDGWTQVIHRDDLGTVLKVYYEAVERRSSYQLEYRMRRADGEYRHMLGTTSPRYLGGEYAGHSGTIVDITDLKLRQEEDLTRRKWEGLGTLASGIAHDFNNLLSAVLVQAEVAVRELAAGSNPEEELRSIREVALRGSEIVRELMVYAGKDNAAAGSVNLSEIVGDMVELLKISVSKRAIIVADLAKDLPLIRANAAQLRQIVMNLVTNASDAIGDKDGLIRVTTRVVNDGLGTRTADRQAGGGFVQLEVADSGNGMSLDTQAKVFDPFFTTKSSGHGIGLAVVNGIVQSLGGRIHLKSEPGKGATFQIWLPCTETSYVSTERVLSSVEDTHSFADAAILLVEDEEPLRTAVAKILRKAGFEVFEAADGFSAIHALRVNGPKIGAILLDFTIPGASSAEVIQEAANVRPDIRVVLTSAYSEVMIADKIRASQIRAFVRKPFLLADIVNALRQQF